MKGAGFRASGATGWALVWDTRLDSGKLLVQIAHIVVKARSLVGLILLMEEIMQRFGIPKPAYFLRFKDSGWWKTSSSNSKASITAHVLQKAPKERPTH